MQNCALILFCFLLYCNFQIHGKICIIFWNCYLVRYSRKADVHSLGWKYFGIWTTIHFPCKYLILNIPHIHTKTKAPIVYLFTLILYQNTPLLVSGFQFNQGEIQINNRNNNHIYTLYTTPL